MPEGADALVPEARSYQMSLKTVASMHPRQLRKHRTLTAQRERAHFTAASADDLHQRGVVILLNIGNFSISWLHGLIACWMLSDAWNRCCRGLRRHCSRRLKSCVNTKGAGTPAVEWAVGLLCASDLVAMFEEPGGGLRPALLTSAPSA